MIQPTQTLTPSPIRVLLVQRRPLDLEATTTLLRSVQNNIVVIGKTSDVQSADSLAKHQQPDVVLLDANFPGYRAFRVARAILKQQDARGVLFLDDIFHNIRIMQSLRIGHSGYFTRTATTEELVDGIIMLSHGRRAFESAVRRCLEETPEGFVLKNDKAVLLSMELTDRELDVLQFLAEGQTVKEAAHRLDLAHNTVDNHKTRLMRKLNLHKAAELTRFAIREGMIDP